MFVEGVETQDFASLQLTSGLDFLSIQAYRLWMEHPSRGKVKNGKWKYLWQKRLDRKSVFRHL
jgi:hypothetical protein